VVEVGAIIEKFIFLHPQFILVLLQDASLPSRLCQ
jgi:hypothetical protein